MPDLQSDSALYPAVNFHFDVKFTGGDIKAEGGFQQVSGLSAKLGTQAVTAGGGTNLSLPTPATFNNITLKRGVMVGSSLRHWVTQAIYNFEFTPITITIMLLDAQQNPIITWTLYNAWPVSWSVDDLNSERSGIAIETFELAFERVTTKFKS